MNRRDIARYQAAATSEPQAHERAWTAPCDKGTATSNVVDRGWDSDKFTWVYTLAEDLCNGQPGKMCNSGRWVEEKDLDGSGNDGD